MERIAICGGRLLTPQGILEQHILLAEDGVITAIIPEITPISTDYRRVDAKGQYVSPGFVDIHQHGAGGSYYMEPDADTYYTVLSTHLKYGTTSVMPTLMSASAEHTIRAARQYVRALADPRISCNLLGLHVEGLYISPEQAGAQNQKQIKAFDPAEYHAICEAAEGHLRRWSVAPELPGADEFARFARDNRITLSIAHSDADFDTVCRAFEIGYRHITHLYSGCSSVVRKNGFRIAGVVEAAYYLDDMDVEIIADGCHLPLSLLKLITKLKKPEHIALITDSIRPTGLDVRESFSGSSDDPIPIVVEDGVAKLLNRQAFAGSIATSDRLIRTMLQAGIALEDAVRMVTVHPLRQMGAGMKKGVLQEGFDADLCIFDEKIHVTQVLIHGKTVYKDAAAA